MFHTPSTTQLYAVVGNHDIGFHYMYETTFTPCIIVWSDNASMVEQNSEMFGATSIYNSGLEVYLSKYVSVSIQSLTVY